MKRIMKTTKDIQEFLANPESYDTLNLGYDYMNFRWKELTGVEYTKLLAILEKNTTLTSLILCNNHIGDKGAAVLAEVLRNNTDTTLTHLNLRGNNIGDTETLISAFVITKVKHLGLGKKVDNLLSTAQTQHKEMSDQRIETLESFIPQPELIDIVYSYIGNLHVDINIQEESANVQHNANCLGDCVVS